MSVLCLVEPDAAGTVASASLRALSLAGGLAAGEGSAAGQLAALVFGAVDQLPLDVLGGAGVTDVYVVPPDHLDGYAPRAWAKVLAGLTDHAAAAAVVAAATDRGSEVMAWLGAITGKPVAANCLSVL